MFGVLLSQRILACGNVIVVTLFHGSVLFLSYKYHVSSGRDETFVADMINVIHVHDKATMAAQEVATLQLVFHLA